MIQYGRQIRAGDQAGEPGKRDWDGKQGLSGLTELRDLKRDREEVKGVGHVVVGGKSIPGPRSSKEDVRWSGASEGQKGRKVERPGARLHMAQAPLEEL